MTGEEVVKRIRTYASNVVRAVRYEALDYHRNNDKENRTYAIGRAVGTLSTAVQCDAITAKEHESAVDYILTGECNDRWFE